MSAERYCAQITSERVVLRVIVCDDISWARAELDGDWVDCDTYLPAIGDVLPDPVPVA